MSLHSYLLFVVAAIVLVLAPDPDMAGELARLRPSRSMLDRSPGPE